ncbi:MAG: protein kinase [Acidobacteriota bacterium]|nr:MAG: protein kinase [Acidobacteriota bacterium]
MSERTTLKHYELLSRIGEGGMGVVYRAMDKRLGRTVALKMLPRELAKDRERSERFEREARIASSISHPGIATLYEFDREGDVAFLTMELVEGRTVGELLREGPLPIDRVLDCGIQVSEALAAAHRQGVVHRDLKPGNIMAADSGYYKILDFGVARVDHSLAGPVDGSDDGETHTLEHATKTGMLLGTLAYMSPEQVLGEPLDARSDIFSLGSVLYELTTGHTAFHGNNQIATAHAILHDEPAPLHVARTDAPMGLEAVINKCLTKSKDDRYASAALLAADLRALRLDSLSGPHSGLRLHAHAPRRRAWKTWLVVSVLAVIGLAVGVASWRMIGAGTAPARRTSVASAPLMATSSPLPAEPRVVVAFFENNTGDTSADWLSHGLPEMLTTDLSRAGGLEVIATQRLRDLMQQAGQGDRQEIDRSTATELARWAGASVVIGGSVFKLGDTYRIDAQAYDTSSGTVLAAHKVEGEDLFQMVGDLTVGLLEGLALKPAEPLRVKLVLTSSPQAFRSYVRGKELYDGLQYTEAIESFRRALDFDASFAVSRLYLALSLQMSGESDDALTLLDRALEQSDRMPERERLLADALHSLLRDGDLEAATPRFEQLIERVPGEKETYVWWARALIDRSGQPLQAMLLLREVLEKDPNYLPAIATLAESLARLGATEDARQLVREAVVRKPEARASLERLIER